MAILSTSNQGQQLTRLWHDKKLSSSNIPGRGQGVACKEKKLVYFLTDHGRVFEWDDGSRGEPFRVYNSELQQFDFYVANLEIPGERFVPLPINDFMVRVVQPPPAPQAATYAGWLQAAAELLPYTRPAGRFMRTCWPLVSAAVGLVFSRQRQNLLPEQQELTSVLVPPPLPQTLPTQQASLPVHSRVVERHNRVSSVGQRLR